MADKAPEEYIRTLVNSERYITPELKEYELWCSTPKRRSNEIELVFNQVCAQLSKSSGELLKAHAESRSWIVHHWRKYALTLHPSG